MKLRLEAKKELEKLQAVGAASYSEKELIKILLEQEVITFCGGTEHGIPCITFDIDDIQDLEA
jgi:hypothetical protein